MNTNDHRKNVLRKLGYVKKGGRKHEKWELSPSGAGIPVLRTAVSHGNKDIKQGTLKSIRDQLRVTKDQYNNIASCKMSKSEYSRHLFDTDSAQ